MCSSPAYTKAKSVPCMPGRYGGMDVYIETFSNSALNGSQWSFLRIDRLTPGERIRDSH